MPPVDIPLIVLGCVGGLLPDLLRAVKGRHKAFPKYWGQPTFWLGLALAVALGGFLAWILEAKAAKEALAYGFGGPAIVTKLLGTSGAVEATRGSFDLRRWWAS